MTTSSEPKVHGESRFVRRSDAIDTDPRKALQRAWHALLRDVDNATDHAAIQRAARATDRAGCERETADWYAAAINHYLSR